MAGKAFERVLQLGFEAEVGFDVGGAFLFDVGAGDALVAFGVSGVLCQ